MRLTRRMLRDWKSFVVTFGMALLAILGIIASRKHSSRPSVAREPQRDVFFLKTHKTAGSSVLNLLLRRADGEGLNLALPKEATSHMMGYPQSFSPRDHMLNYSQCGLRPNLMALHMRFNETGVKEVRKRFETRLNCLIAKAGVMPVDTVYVTILRRPTDAFASLFYYFELHNVYDANLTAFLKQPFFVQPTVYVIKKASNPGRSFSPHINVCFVFFALSVHPQTVRNSRLHGSLGFNQMAFDLGVDGDDMADRGSVEEISRFVESVDRTFHLVMIAERFTESLVLLRDLLGWQLDDVVTFKHNMRLKRYPRPDEEAVRCGETA
ncbi:galactose-3-O-sulfotransferase 3-like [Rhipicephalus microplus]|uniref:galactose-3-O-sulfotransferase 3-like n=1 Tax=Rhipicephalus microplus TaxID=6941 RepID=UPI003F6AB3B3